MADEYGMCQPLFDAGLATIQPRVRNATSVSLFLDFDGTLTPIVDDPSQARLEQSTWELLGDLAKCPDILTVIITGRSLADIQDRVGVDELVYAGNHGLEISGRGLRFVEPFAAARREVLSRMSRSLSERLHGIAGVRVEYKGLTTSVHYRQADPERLRDIEQIVDTVVRPDVSPFFLDAGKMVLEVLPRSNWHKGAAVCWINSRLADREAVSIYVGDDRTDETAFRALADEITVCVGRPEWTSANFFVSDPGGVCRFLSWLEDIKRPSEDPGK